MVETATRPDQKFCRQMPSLLSSEQKSFRYTIYYEIHPFNNCYLILEHVHHPKMKPCTHEQSLPFPLSPIPGNH